MKYIPADKLIAEIDSIWKHYLDRDEYDYGFNNALHKVKDFIFSLQQEQPEGLHFTPLNRLIQKIPSENWNDAVNNYAKKLRDCLIKEGYLKDADVLQGYISYLNGNNVPMATIDEQVQPEVELSEHQIADIIQNLFPIDQFIESESLLLDKNEAILFARHFYELGLNARKED